MRTTQNIIRAHLRYALYLAAHKYHVARACFKEGIVIRGILHDWHKLLPSEWFPYVRHFYGDQKDKCKFDMAWLKHQHRGDHHWQHWALREDDGSLILLPMSHGARLEMVCDWYGASMVQGKGGWNETKKWFFKSLRVTKIELHLDTLDWVKEFLREKASS